MSKKINTKVEKLVWKKLIQIQDELIKDGYEEDLSEHIVSFIGIKFGYIENQSKIYELQCIVHFISHLFPEQSFTLEQFNKLYDNLTEEEWNDYIDNILNY